MAVIPSVHIHNFSYISVCTHVMYLYMYISVINYTHVHVLIAYPSIDMIGTK